MEPKGEKNIGTESEGLDVQKNKEQLKPIIRILNSVVFQFNNLDQDADRFLALGNHDDYQETLEREAMLLIGLPGIVKNSLGELSDEKLSDYISNTVQNISNTTQEKLNERENKNEEVGNTVKLRVLIKYLEEKNN